MSDPHIAPAAVARAVIGGIALIARAQFEAVFNGPIVGRNLGHRTIRGSAIAMTAEGAEFVLRLTSIIVLARILVPEYFGLVAMVTAITAAAEQFKDLGLSVATIQRKVIHYDLVSTMFWINVAAGLGITLAICALAAPIALFYEEPRLVDVCIALSASFLFGGATVQHQALLRRKMQFGKLALVQVVSSALSIVLAIALAVAGAGYWSLVAREVSKALFLLVGTWICMPWIPGRPKLHRDIKSMLIFGGDVTASNLTHFLTSNLDQIIVGKLFGAVPLGVYRQGVNLVLSPIMQLTYPVQTVAEAALSQLQDSSERYRHYYRRFVMALAALTMPLASFMMVFAHDIVLVALGEKWMPAAPFLQILALAAIIRPAASTIGLVMVTCGQSRRYLWFGLVRAALLIAFMLFGVQWGAEGVAYAHVAIGYLPLLAFLYWGTKGTPVGIGQFLAAIANPVRASLAMIAATVWLQHEADISQPVYRLLVGGLVAIPVYAAAWLVFPSGRAALGDAFTSVLAMLRGGQPPKA